MKDEKEKQPNEIQFQVTYTKLHGVFFYNFWHLLDVSLLPGDGVNDSELTKVVLAILTDEIYPNNIGSNRNGWLS